MLQQQDSQKMHHATLLAVAGRQYAPSEKIDGHTASEIRSKTDTAVKKYLAALSPWSAESILMSDEERFLAEVAGDEGSIDAWYDKHMGHNSKADGGS